jgi:uncharacterized protein
MSAEYGDAVTQPFWEGTSQGKLLVQKCNSCTAYQHYPRALCVRCTSLNLTMSESSGLGHIYSETTVHIAVNDLEPPYQLAIIELDEGFRMLSRVVGKQGQIGSRVAVQFLERQGLPPLPVFQVIGESL